MVFLSSGSPSPLMQLPVGEVLLFLVFLDAFCGLVVEYDLQQLHAHVYMKICILGCTNFPC